MQTSLEQSPSENGPPNLDEPDPDYQKEDSVDGIVVYEAEMPQPLQILPQSHLLSSDVNIDDNKIGVAIPPKKLFNPCMDSRNHKLLHQELIFRHKQGQEFPKKKSELEQTFGMRNELRRKKEWDEQKTFSNKRTSLDLKLAHQANKLKEDEEKIMNPIKENSEGMSEIEKVRAKIIAKSSNDS